MEPADSELDVADELGVQLVRLIRLINRVKGQVVKKGPDGIEHAAYAILSCLVHDGPQRTTQLAESLRSEISTISRQSSSLVQHGLVERQADPEDGRACRLAPTSEGLRIFEESRHQRKRWLTEVLADWPEADRQELNRLFAQLNSDIEAHTSPLANQTWATQPGGKHA
jgi:DNA-binding MarR family transcriptional regulator